MAREVYGIVAIECAILAILLASTTVSSDGATPIPANAAQVNAWFQKSVPALASRKGTLNATLQGAEAQPITIKVRKDGSGNFKTLTEAVASVPTGNYKRVIIDIGPGVYTEKVIIDKSKPFITLVGSRKNMPTLQFSGTAKKYGTVYSATLQVEADFFTANNVIIKNIAPKPDGKMAGAQAVALRLAGDNSALYNCRIIGFQDTLCDDKGRHFFKDCYIEGTVDFIFGNAKSLYLNTELHVLADSGLTVITAHARQSQAEDTGFSFVHCRVTGVGSGAYLGRAWMEKPRVVFAFSTMSSVVSPLGWWDNNHPDRDQKVSFGEYQCSGPGFVPNGRVKYSKQLTAAEANPFISLGFIQGSSWLLPPRQV